MPAPQTLEEQQAAAQQARPPTPSDDDQPNGGAAAQLASKAHEMYCLQEELLQQRQKLANQEILVQELFAAVQAAKNKAQQAQDDGHRQAPSNLEAVSSFIAHSVHIDTVALHNVCAAAEGCVTPYA